jgi:hypothetical protein
MKGILVAVIVVIAGIAAIALFTQTFTDNYETKQISHNTNFNPVNSRFYEGEFNVWSSEVQVDRAPELLVEIIVFDSGNGDYEITIHYAIYETDRATYNSLNESSRESLLLVSRNGLNRVNDRIVLHSIPMTYVWVLRFQADEKTSPWSIDIRLTLLYNWGLN